MIDKGFDNAPKAVAAAQEMGGKMKQTAQDAWSSAKVATKKISDTVASKAEDAKESIKQMSKD